MRLSVLILASLLVSGTQAGAACFSTGETVLSCTARGGTKALDVCIEGPQIVYRYGPNGGTPELTMSRTVAEVEHQPWNGVGRSIWESTTFRNGSYAYEVYISVDRMAEGNPSYSGVTVYRDSAQIAEVRCDPGSDSMEFWAVSDAKKAVGICWDPTEFRWGGCG